MYFIIMALMVMEYWISSNFIQIWRCLLFSSQGYIKQTEDSGSLHTIYILRELLILKYDCLLSLCCVMKTGLSRLTTDQKLQEAFSPFGQLVDGKRQTYFGYISSLHPSLFFHFDQLA